MNREKNHSRLFVFFALVALLRHAPLFAVSCEPSLKQLEPPKTGFVVMGLGDVIGKYYSSAWANLMDKYKGAKKLSVTFLNDGRFAQGNPAMQAKQQQIADGIRKWGGNVVDISQPGSDEILAKLNPQPEIGTIATPDSTHAALAQDLWRRFPSLKRINVEKPLDADPKAAEKLASPSEPISQKIRAMDHYLARMPHEPEQLKQIFDHLGNQVTDFTFYFLEDGSGADPNLSSQVARDGSIENAQREKALNRGVMLDLMPHVLAVMGYFGKVDSIDVEELRAGQYTGVDGDPNKRTSIQGETFAKVKFTFQDPKGRPVNATAYVGKGIRGSKQLGPNYDHNTKVLDVVGVNGNKVRFDFRSKGNGAASAHFLDAQGNAVRTPLTLESNPYQAFFDGEINGHPNGTLPASDGLKIVQVLEHEMINAVQAQPQLTGYAGGMKGVRSAPYTEDLEHLPVIYSKSQATAAGQVAPRAAAVGP